MPVISREYGLGVPPAPTNTAPMAACATFRPTRQQTSAFFAIEQQVFQGFAVLARLLPKAALLGFE